MRPQEHARVAGQPRPLQPLLGRGDRVGDPPELDERGGRLDRAHEQHALAAGLGGERGAALELGERGGRPAERALRAPAHPQARQPDRELLRR